MPTKRRRITKSCNEPLGDITHSVGTQEREMDHLLGLIKAGERDAAVSSALLILVETLKIKESARNIGDLVRKD
jgi:hypothetical protein